MTTPSKERLHWSDCAVNRAPALPPGPCDCGGLDPAPDMTPTKAEREELRALLAKATPGPWTHHSEDLRGGEYHVVGRPVPRPTGTEDDWDSIDIHALDNGASDARLIVALRNRAAALLDELDRAEAKAQEQHDIVARIWVQLGSPTYEQLAGRSIYDMVDELKVRAETAEATIARLTAPVTEDEWRGFVMKAMWFREAGNVETPTWEALTAFLEGRKGSTLSPPERAKE